MHHGQGTHRPCLVDEPALDQAAERLKVNPDPMAKRAFGSRKRWRSILSIDYRGGSFSRLGFAMARTGLGIVALAFDVHYLSQL